MLAWGATLVAGAACVFVVGAIFVALVVGAALAAPEGVADFSAGIASSVGAVVGAVLCGRASLLALGGTFDAAAELEEPCSAKNATAATAQRPAPIPA